jgi:uncharacterized cupin superfamily protein
VTAPLHPLALDPAGLPEENRTGYPEPYRALVAGRFRRRLGDALGLTRFGVNLTRLEPGSASAQRHWHSREDELVYVLEGELTLVTDAGEQLLTSGMCAAFKAVVPDGHHLVNRSDRQAVLLEIGNRDPDDEAAYPDIDLRYTKGGTCVRKSSGEPW